MLAAEDPASREAPRTVQRASLYLFKWWLGRDRQFSFCFRCFQLAAEQLRRIQCTDTPVTSTASDTKPPRVGLERPSDASCRSPLRGDDVYGLLADDEAVGGSPSCAQEHLPLADVDILEIFGKRFSTLSHIIVLTSRIWLQLLTLVLKHMRVDDARYAAAPDAQAPGSHSTEALTALIPFDDILLTLQFQSRMTSSAVLITQLSAYKGIVDAHDGQTSSPFRSEAFRALLPTFSFHPAHLDIMLPHITSRRQFLINAMQSIRCEFGIAKNLLTQGKEQLGVGEGQQIREQLKRSILERTQSLAMISNAAVLGFLTVVPLERGGSGQLVRDIESFLYIPRWTQSCKRTTTSGGRYVLSSGAGTETRHQPTTHAAASATFYLRVLGYSTSLMIAGLQMLLGLEGVHLNLSSLVEHAAETSTPLPPHQFQPGYRPSPPPTDNKYIGSASTALLAELQPHSALLRHTLSAVHPTLGSPTQLRALRLCGRSAATVMGMSDIPGFASGAARFASQAETQPESLPLHLFHASAKIVCVEVFTLQTLLVAVTA